MSANELRTSLQSILRYLSHYWDFVNCHMVNYLTDNHWEKFVPRNLREDIGNVEHVNQCIEDVFWNESVLTRFQNIHHFVQDSKKFRLENMQHLLTSVNDLHYILNNEEGGNLLSIKEFMSEKKRHEVEMTAELVNDLMTHFKTDENKEMYIIDAGDGKGYLSSRLALQYDHKVLGIDIKESNTENAAERNKKLQRAWNGLTKRAELQSQGIVPPRRGKKEASTEVILKADNYKTTNMFITSQIDFVDLVRKYFNFTDGQSSSFCLTGLHTCGNLAPTCLQIFKDQSDFKILCNIGCCYHLLKEEFSSDEFFGNKAILDQKCTIGFPMSDFLRKQSVKIGRNARMLAAQSVHRTQHAKELPNKSLFYRALLEVLIVEMNPNLKNTVQVGKIKKFNDFKEYVDLCNKTSNLGLEVFTDDHIRRIEATYLDQKKFLDLFYLIRMCFSPILETLILLDRLLYLKEGGFERSYIVPLFDPVISPRHFCITALK